MEHPELPLQLSDMLLASKKKATRIVHEWHIINSVAAMTKSDGLRLRLGFLLPLCPTNLHHLRDTLAGSGTHGTAFPALGGTRRSSGTAARFAGAFQGPNCSFNPVTFTFEI